MTDIPLNQKLFDEAYRFEFFQAVRLLDTLYPDKKPIGTEAMPDEETVRFRSRITLDFPSGEVHEIVTSFDEASDRERVEMIENFMGLIGVSGVLPVHYTEVAMDRIRHQDTSLWNFLDIFTHRGVSMFFRAWAKYRFQVGYERGQDEFGSYLFDFGGLGTKGLRGRMSLEDESLLPYTGLISQKPHSTNAIENIISDYFGIKAKAEQFFGQWLPLDEQDRTFVGVANFQLGVNTVAGTRVWDQQSKFRLRLGPLTFDQFRAFLPNGTANKPLRSIARLLVGDEFDFDIQPTLAKKQVPATVLTTRALRRPMLGWTTFLKTRPFKKDDEQLVLQAA